MLEAADWILWVGAGAAGSLVAAAALRDVLFGRPTRPSLPEADPVFLLDGEMLLDASRPARAMLTGADGKNDWADVTHALRMRFEGVPASPDELREAGRVVRAPLRSGDQRDLVAEWIDGIARFHLRPRGASPGVPVEGEADTAILHAAMRSAPFPAWMVDAAGCVRWHNAAYDALYRRIRGKAPEAAAPLFPQAEKGGNAQARVSISPAGREDRHWYDVAQVPYEAGHIFHAANVDAVVQAETAQRNFVQTLAKTFAQLSTGLAIFDRNRRLMLFNPALIDLTALPADFLSARPALLSFFDRLRDAQIMPEPKNYSSFRERMEKLVAAASDGSYVETWSLPSGPTYRVIGRPHPDGAVAFLFEDITAEITLTRRFRSDLELGQSMLDALEDAIAVFTRAGTMSMSNAAYRTLWRSDPEAGFAEMTILDASRLWQAACLPTPVWGELRDFVHRQDQRADWTADVILRDGGRLRCAVSPVHAGATMVSFRTLPAEVRPALPDAAAAPA